MTKFFQTSDRLKIAYDFVKKGPRSPVMVYHTGLFLPKNFSLADEFKDLARTFSMGFLAFDNVGHGESQGRAIDFGLSGMSSIALEVISGIVDEPRPLIMVGHSFGSLVLFTVAANFQRPMSGFIGVNPVWHRSDGLSKREGLRERGLIDDRFIEDMRLTERENEKARLKCPAIIFRGVKDLKFTQDQASSMQAHFVPSATIVLHDEEHTTEKRKTLDAIATHSTGLLENISAPQAP